MKDRMGLVMPDVYGLLVFCSFSHIIILMSMCAADAKQRMYVFGLDSDKYVSWCIM